MHLLRVLPGDAPDRARAVHLGQTPGDMLILSSADSEIGLLAQARRQLGPEWRWRVRLANIDRLMHPMSVDNYLENMAGKARLIVLRILGGESYWPYGVGQMARVARENGIALVALPGDDRVDPVLERLSTVDPAVRMMIWRYLIEGGPENAVNLLRFAETVISGHEAGQEAVAPPHPMPKAGLYRPVLAQPHGNGKPKALVLFYRSWMQSGDLATIDALLASLHRVGLSGVPIFVNSLRDEDALGAVERIAGQAKPDLVLSCLGFAAPRRDGSGPALAFLDCPVLQTVLSASEAAVWRSSSAGLLPRDLAMHVALPELDGRILTRVIAGKDFSSYDEDCQTILARLQPIPDRINQVAATARRWVAMRQSKARRIAICIGNAPGRDGRIGNGVGLDTPASVIEFCQLLRRQGDAPPGLPTNVPELMARFGAGPSNARPAILGPETPVLSVAKYREWLDQIPISARQSLTQYWREPEHDPMVTHDTRSGEPVFALPALDCGSVVLAIQPSRAHGVETRDTQHDPAMPPPHGYLAFYWWLRRSWGMDVLVQMGKHGTLEWLPGKALGLSEECFPEIVGGDVPILYPFIVNDPGEGTQAKRRSGAVIIDHMTPPLTQAGNYGELAVLDRLIDEYHEAATLDPRRLAVIGEDILSRAAVLGLDQDCGIVLADLNRNGREGELRTALQRLDGYLCELKDLQIRDGLHILGVSPTGERLDTTLLALARVPRGSGGGKGGGKDASLLQSLADDLRLGWDPLAVEEPALEWCGPRPVILREIMAEHWRSQGDTVERLEKLALHLVAGRCRAEPAWQASLAVLGWIEGELRPLLRACGDAERLGLERGLAGRFVMPGPSGAPSRGRIDVLPTGRNFYSVDPRAIPTASAWTIGWRTAQGIVARYQRDHGTAPRTMVLSAWGTACMRTGGDDIAQAMALMGVRPSWDETGRMTGFEILPLDVLGRARVEVVLRVSGFFRDAFSEQIALIDRAGRAVADLPEADNPLREGQASRRASLLASGACGADAERRAGYRVFSAPPGGYGTGLQTPIEQSSWHDEAELAEIFLRWGGQAYGADGDEAGSELLAEHLASVDLVLHNQDNREHDILDSDDYWQFAGGLALSIRHLTGREVPIFHTDSSRPDHPVTRDLKSEIARLVRGRLSQSALDCRGMSAWL